MTVTRKEFEEIATAMIPGVAAGWSVRRSTHPDRKPGDIDIVRLNPDPAAQFSIKANSYVASTGQALRIGTIFHVTLKVLAEGGITDRAIWLHALNIKEYMTALRGDRSGAERYALQIAELINRLDQELSAAGGEPLSEDSILLGKPIRQWSVGSLD